MKRFTIFVAALLLASCSMGTSKPANILTGATQTTQSGAIEITTTKKPANASTQTGTTAEVINPASKNCTEQGGKLEIKTQPGGGQYGVCVFSETRQCEEWAMYRGDCKKGGRNISVYNSDAQIFCAITGGIVHMSKKPPICELPGKLGFCTVDEYYSNGNSCVPEKKAESSTGNTLKK